MATPNGPDPTVESILAAKDNTPVVLVFLRIETVLENWLPMAKSSLPSPSRSPAATLEGPAPVVRSTFVANASVPLLLVFLNRDTLSEPLLVAINSGLPSPSKSADATLRGWEAVVKSVLVVKDIELMAIPPLNVTRKGFAEAALKPVAVFNTVMGL